MTDQTIATPPTGCCQHYPNRVRQKKQPAAELGVCENDVHAFISAAAGSPHTDAAPSGTAASKDDKKAKGSAHKAGKFCV